MSRADLKEESVGELLKEMGQGTTDIMRKEVQLARAELEQTMERTARASIWLVVALGPVFSGRVLVALGLVYGLDAWMPRWVAGLVTAAAMFGAAGILALIGYRKLKDVDPKPQRAIDEAKEETQWLKNRVSSNVRSMKSGVASTTSPTS